MNLLRAPVERTEIDRDPTCRSSPSRPHRHRHLRRASQRAHRGRQHGCALIAPRANASRPAREAVRAHQRRRHPVQLRAVLRMRHLLHGVQPRRCDHVELPEGGYGWCSSAHDHCSLPEMGGPTPRDRHGVAPRARPTSALRVCLRRPGRAGMGTALREHRGGEVVAVTVGQPAPMQCCAMRWPPAPTGRSGSSCHSIRPAARLRSRSPACLAKQPRSGAATTLRSGHWFGARTWPTNSASHKRWAWWPSRSVLAKSNQPKSVPAAPSAHCGGSTVAGASGCRSRPRRVLRGGSLHSCAAPRCGRLLARPAIHVVPGRRQPHGTSPSPVVPSRPRAFAPPGRDSPRPGQGADDGRLGGAVAHGETVTSNQSGRRSHPRRAERMGLSPLTRLGDSTWTALGAPGTAAADPGRADRLVANSTDRICRSTPTRSSRRQSPMAVGCRPGSWWHRRSRSLRARAQGFAGTLSIARPFSNWCCSKLVRRLMEARECARQRSREATRSPFTAPLRPDGRGSAGAQWCRACRRRMPTPGAPRPALLSPSLPMPCA